MNSISPGELHVVILGLNHITAPVWLRDKAHFSREDIRLITKQLLAQEDFHEIVILSTCNRSELYAVTSRPDGKESVMEELWCNTKGLNTEELHQHSYYLKHTEAINHLFRVVSSLDSMVVGENQILGQVKEAYEYAIENSSVDYFFNFLFQAAFRVGKRVRSETSLNEGAVSISYAAVELAKKVLGRNLNERVAGVVGSGEMGELTAFHLNKTGVSKFIFFNRSLNRAEKVAARFGGEIHTLPALNEKLCLCDIIVSCTGALDPVILKEHVEKAIKLRNGMPMFLIDIAAPRDIEEDVQHIKNTFLFTIDDLKEVVGNNLLLRQDAAKTAMTIVEEETTAVETWYHNLELGETIKKLRQKFNDVVNKELSRHLKNQAPEVADTLEKLARGLLGKFLHTPITGLKNLSEKGGGRRASQIAEQIFLLNNDNTD
ncbi:MAG: glutamyl-tRNA reductase [Fibrobacteria bacterium]|nr:glutamyl-tRNA reductase [Fibrobacteria bacterium]